MDHGMKALCTICARGGSQGVKNKNLISLKRKPLIAHTILQAQQAGIFDVIAVSTDSTKIKNTAKKFGVTEIIDRPKEMATSTAPKLPAIQHAVRAMENKYGRFDIIVDLDATSPLRSISDITDAFKLLMNHPTAENLVTAYPARRSPYFNMLEVGQEGFVKLAKNPENPVFRRQDSPLCYDMNASIYIWKRDPFFQNQQVITERTLLHIMPEERSIDIDSLLDLQLVRLLVKEREDIK
jgi:CMP-N,N'-diacetyllegionaminic acid synthase